MRTEDVLRAPLRHWRKTALVWLLIVSATVAVTALMSKRFRSEGKLFVRLGRENATLDPTVTVGNGNFVSLPPSREDEINSVVQVLLSRGMAEKVVDSFGPEFFLDKPAASATPPPADPVEPSSTMAAVATDLWDRITPFEPVPSREKAIEQFLDRLKVGGVKRANVINLTFEASSPEKAQAVLTKLVEFYLDEHTRLNRMPGSFEFLGEQAQQSQQRLKEIEDELQRLKSESLVASIEEQRTILETRNGSLQDKLFDAQAQLEEAVAEVGKLEAMLKVLPDTLVTARVEGNSNEAADLMRQQLYALQIREKELLTRFKEDYFLVKDIRKQIAEAKAILDAENDDRTHITTALNQVEEHFRLALLTRQASRTALEARIAALQRQKGDTETAIAGLNERALQIARLEREAEIQESGYRKYAENLEQTRLDQALETENISNVVLAQPPTLELKATRPKRALNYAIGLILATAASLSWAVLAEYLRPGRTSAAYLTDEVDAPYELDSPRRARPSLSAAELEQDEEIQERHALSRAR